MLKNELAFILSLASIVAISQKKPKPEWYNMPYFFVPHIGYEFQGINTIETGIRLLTLFKSESRHENISIMGNALFFKRNVMYVSPELKIRYFKPLKFKFKDGLFGVGGSLSYWSSKVLAVREHRITPEIGFSAFQRLNFSYGYNIPVSINTLSFISTNRISVRWLVF